MRFGRSIAGVALVTTMAGCVGSYPNVHLEPAYENVLWANGRPLVWTESDGVRVATAFDGRDGGILGLGVELANTGHWELEVDPSQFTFTTCRDETFDKCRAARSVFSAERMFTELDAGQRRTAGGHAAGVALAVVLVLVVVGVFILAASQNSHHDYDDDSHDHDDCCDCDAADYPTSGSSSVAPQRPDPVRDAWLRNALQRTTLAPGRAVGGTVFVPVDPSAKYVWLHVRAGEQWFSFRYRQTVTAGQ